MRQRRSYQTMKLEQMRDEARRQTPPRPSTFDADLGRHNSRYPGGGMVANGLNKGSGALDDRAIRYQSGTQTNYYPPEPTAEAEGIGDMLLSGGGTPTQALVFGVNDTFEIASPGGGLTGLYQVTASRIYVKVGTNSPQQVLELQQERYIQLHQQAFGRSSSGFAGITNIQTCSILSSNEFLILAEVPRDGSGVLRAMYAALFRGGTLVQEQIFSAIDLRPEDPDVITWLGGLAAYADWLPTTREERGFTGFSLPFPVGSLYIGAEGITAIRTGNDNVDGRGRKTTIDPESSILPSKVPNSVVFPLQPFIEGATVPVETADGESSMELSFPIEDWAAMGLEGLNIYGYIMDAFGDLDPISIPVLYVNPSIASDLFSGFAMGVGLILSSGTGTEGYRGSPFKIFTLARAVAIEV